MVDDEMLKSNLQRAIETDSPEAVDALDKSETVFYISFKLGAEPEAEHPSEHNGTVSRKLSQQWAQALAEGDTDETESEE